MISNHLESDINLTAGVRSNGLIVHIVSFISLYVCLYKLGEQGCCSHIKVEKTPMMSSILVGFLACMYFGLVSVLYVSGCM